MASHSPKRRKLEHDSDLSDESESDLAVVEEELEEMDTTETTANGQAQKRTVNGEPKSSKPIDPTAMYAGDAYKSSMFKLQVDEMLSEVRPNYTKRMRFVNDALVVLKISIESIKPRDPLAVSDAVKAMRKLKVVIPFPEPKPDPNANYKLAYASPSNVNVVGSYALQTMVKAEELSVDMVLTMPESILQEKDYLNYRYFYKRAYYLACIAASLQSSEFDIHYDTLNGNELQPILVVKAVKGSAHDFSASKCSIRIIPAAPEGFFAEVKLRPTKNCVRPTMLNEDSTATPSPTPFYNATLQADGAYSPYLKLLHHASKQADGFKDACILGRIWLKQRGFGSSLAKGGFGSFEWAAMTALLLQGGGSKDHPVLSPEYSSYQLFKAVIQYLGSKDLVSKPVVFQASGVELAKTGQPVFYDGPRKSNILYKMTPSSYSSLFEEGKLSLEMLNDATFDQFESTFIIRKDHPLYQYDSLFSLKKPTQTSKSSSQDHLTHERELSLKVYEVLREGLTDRIKLVSISGSGSLSWGLNSVPAPKVATLVMGFTHDPANFDRLVDHGPPAEEKKKAARFQKFWGDKAELRRFKDGSILESVVWTIAEGPIFNQIIQYLIKRHVGGEVHFLGDDVAQLLPVSASSMSFTAMKEAYRQFETDIRGLEKLPLQLKQLSAIDPQLRLSSIRPPIFSERQSLREPASVIIQFEGSGRWPDDVVAIQRTKVAFLLKIGELLESSVDRLLSKLGLENAEKQYENCAYLDVVYPSGASFRLRIQNDREEFLLNRIIKDKTTENHVREEAVAASSYYKQTCSQLPLITQSIATHCTRFPLLSPTIRLLKKWFEAHLLTLHIPTEIIELLAVRTFMQPYPWRTPTSASTAFLRTLQFIARWDWRTTPLVVDFGGIMTEKDIAAVNIRLQAWRKLDPAMNRVVLIVATSHDSTGTVFTDGKPTKVIAARMTALARSAVELVKDIEQNISPKSLFKPSLADFDFVIHIAPKFTGTNRGTSKADKTVQFKNIEIQTQDDLPLIGYEPIGLFIQELEENYRDSLLFFHDAISNNVIGGLWNPQAAAKRSFRVNLGYASKPIGAEKDGEQIVIDKESILNEISRLGADMITKIEKNR